jgi:hypothetical protein
MATLPDSHLLARGVKAVVYWYCKKCNFLSKKCHTFSHEGGYAASALAKGIVYMMACKCMISPTKGILGQLMKAY